MTDAQRPEFEHVGWLDAEGRFHPLGCRCMEVVPMPTRKVYADAEGADIGSQGGSDV